MFSKLLKLFDLRDLIALLGLLLVAGGLLMVYVPAALVVSGAILLLVAFWPALRPMPRRER